MKPRSRTISCARLDLPFTNVLPVHGTPVLGGATKHFKPPVVERATSR